MFFLSPIIEALHIQKKLDETTKLLRDLQEAQKERLSAKQPPNMICLLAPTAKELDLGKKPLCIAPFVPPLKLWPAVDLEQHLIVLAF